MNDFDTFDENPQYVCQVPDENLDEDYFATLIINLLQKGGHEKKGQGVADPFHNIGQFQIIHLLVIFYLIYFRLLFV